ncbi:MAG: hypothetical protein WAN60_10340 [Candidatus Sulfotelmatobacter sp.]
MPRHVVGEVLLLVAGRLVDLKEELETPSYHDVTHFMWWIVIRL